MINKSNKLHLGCGTDIRQGFINLDSVKLPGVDIVHNLDKFPWPFKDNSFEYIISISTLEHLENLIKVMEEIHRICKNNAIIEIRVPHFASLGAFKDPTHRIFFSYYSMDYFTKDFDYNFYTKARFNIIERKIIYGSVFKIFQGISNLFPKIHEIILRKFLPVQDLYFKLEVIK
ncbi:methyltransferase domain-containing protein [Candidatus Pacearchaeota archaeon]|nr:methyltransferase domain-containing protein [Candidatus Pacearchaeota archaeon]